MRIDNELRTVVSLLLCVFIIVLGLAVASMAGCIGTIMDTPAGDKYHLKDDDAKARKAS